MALGDMSEKQLLGLTAGVVGAILLVMAGILLWIYLRYSGLKGDIKEKTAIAADLKKKARELPDTEQEYAMARAQFQETLISVPEGDQETDLDAQISAQAAKAKLGILRIEKVKEGRSRRNQPTTGKLKPIKIHVKAEGSFNAFGEFLNNIEQKMKRFVAVTGFKITGYEEGLAPGMGPHEITLDLVTYKYSGKKKPAGKASPTTAGR